MLNLGKINTLHVLRDAPCGMFLGEVDGDEDVLLPNKYVPDDLYVSDSIDVFLYTDSEDRMIATTLTPKILLDQFAVLKVSDVTDFGIFLDWGLEKDLFLPFSEQKERLQVGDLVTVFLKLDESTNRLFASAKIDDFIKQEITVKEKEEVELLVDRKTELGYVVIINNVHTGLIYSNEVFQPLKRGDKIKGFIKSIREDGKIDVSLQKHGYAKVSDSQDIVLKKLEENNGVLFLTDKSDPDLIIQKLQMSKKAFKKSIGALYKQRKIKIETDRIVLCV
jgi:predicted RNA-binding protein (virulence factor B family)